MPLRRLNVLVMERQLGLADATVANLLAAGHSVFRCHPDDLDVGVCDGLRVGAQCPLHKYDIDVAVAVHGADGGAPSAGEAGTFCALDHHVPLVVVVDADEPTYRWTASATVERTADVPVAIGRVTGTGHSVPDPSTADLVIDVVETSRASSVNISKGDGAIVADVDVSVARLEYGLQANVTGEVPIGLRRAVTQAIIGKLRAIERDVVQVDVSFDARSVGVLESDASLGGNEAHDTPDGRATGVARPSGGRTTPGQ